MTNIDKVSLAVSEWGYNVMASILPKINIPAQSAIGKFMYGMLGVDPSSYNVWKELGFLAEPTMQVIVTPMLHKVLDGMPDEQVKDVAMKYADAFVERVKEKGSINLFGMQMGEDAFNDLREMLKRRLENE